MKYWIIAIIFEDYDLLGKLKLYCHHPSEALLGFLKLN